MTRVAQVVELGDEAAWPRLSRYFGHQDYIALALAVLDLSETQRREVATAVRRHVAPRAEEPFRQIDEPAVAIIGAGTLPDATSTARWLARHGMSGVSWEHDDRRGGQRPRSFDVVPQVLFVLSRRGVDWLPQLTRTLAERIPVGYAGYDPRFRLVERLVAEIGLPIPTSDGFVANWVAEHDPDVAVGAVAADPRLAALVTKFFDVDAVGAMFDREPRWSRVIVELARRGLVDPDAVLDACLARLVRGGKPGASRAYLGVHELLDPTREDVVARVDSYLDLLADTPSTVAGMAQRRLAEMEVAGRLGEQHVLTWIERGLRRSEKKLVRAALAEVRRTAARDAGRRDALARVVAVALATLPADLFRTATAVIVELDLPVSMRRDVLELASHQRLPIDLREALTGALGLDEKPAGPETARPAAVSGTVRAVTAGERRLPLLPIATLPELIEDTTAILAGPLWDPTGAQLWRVLDGLVRWGRDNPVALAADSAPLRSRVEYGFLCEHHTSGHRRDVRHATADLLEAALGSPQPDVEGGDGFASPDGLEPVVVDAVHDLARLLRRTPNVRLISLPTWTNGVLSAGDLLARLQAAHAEGWEPWDIDLDIALLRVDPDTAAGSVEGLTALGSAAGRRAAEWIAVGRPRSPAITVSAEPWEYQVPYGEHRSGRWLQPQLPVEPTDPQDGVTWARLSTPCKRVWDPPSGCLWPSLAPRCRELIAAQWLRTVGPPMSGEGPDARILGELVEAEGLFGPATAAALGYALGRSPKRQAPATDALVRFTSSADFDAALLGRMLGRLCATGTVVATRLIVPLRAAADAGGAVTWDVLRAMLDELLTGDGGVSGTAALLELAAGMVERLGVGGDVDGLADLAARKGGSRQVLEARRLLGLLQR